MKTKPLGEAGFVPMLFTILLVVAAVIYLIYTRVLHASK